MSPTEDHTEVRVELTLTDDQEFFRETTQRFLSNECPLTHVRSLGSTEAGFEPSYWRQGADLGWTSLLVPESDGGGSISGDGVVDLTIVADAFGRHVAPGPLGPTNVVASTVARSGSDAQRDAVLAGLLSGTQVTAWCGSERAIDDGTAPDPLTAVATAEGFVVSGRTGPVEAASSADHLLVTAAGEPGPVQFLIPSPTEGVSISPLRSLDHVRRFASVEFSEVRVPSSARLGEETTAAADIERQLQVALVIQSAEMVGAAERTLEFTIEWAFDRYSFGRPLASYQELKHRFADMKTWLEAGHALAAALAREVQAGDPAAAETASITKAYLGEYLVELMQDCVQMHGGIGLTADHDLHLFLRRMTVDRSLHGLPATHRGRIAAIQAAEAA